MTTTPVRRRTPARHPRVAAPHVFPPLPTSAPARAVRVTIADRVLRFVRDELGSPRAHTVPGEAFLPFLQAAEDNGYDVRTARHEGGAAFAAMADAKLTGAPGLVAVNRAPGAANAMVAVDAAAGDGTRMLVLVGGADRVPVGRPHDPRLVFQGTEIERLLGGVAPVVTLGDPACVEKDLDTVAGLITRPVPGPVVLVVPEDLWDTELPATGSHRTGPRPAAEPQHTCSELLCALATSPLMKAQHPVIVAGGLLREDDGHAVLAEFARRAGVPVLTANKQQDLLDNRHPHYAGHLHLGSHPDTKALLREADLVMMLGCLPDEVHTSGWYDVTQRLLVLHPEPVGPGEHLACDPSAALKAMNRSLQSAEHADEVAAIAESRLTWTWRWRDLEDELSLPVPRHRTDGVDFTQVAVALGDLLPPHSVVTVDAGNFSSWIHRYLRLDGTQRLLGVAGGSMGFGIPAAVAAASRRTAAHEVAAPTVAVVGDGGALMTGNELAGSRCGDHLVVVVADNGSYGTIRGHAARRGTAGDCATSLHNPDLAAWAGAFGFATTTVTSPHEVRAALELALSPRPCGAGRRVLVRVMTSLTAVHANFDLPGAPNDDEDAA